MFIIAEVSPGFWLNVPVLDDCVGAVGARLDVPYNLSSFNGICDFGLD